MKELIPHHFKVLSMGVYDGPTDPYDYLESFKTLMMLQGA